MKFSSAYRLAAVFVAVGSSIGLAACGGGDDDAPNASPPTTLSCAQLATATVSATAIGLPTRGAVVTSAAAVAASGAGVGTIGAYCLVSGLIKPVDTGAPNIQFQVALPDVWNSKVLMMGGGGYDGTIPDLPSASSLYGLAADAKLPLARGYAVFASDSGHQASAGVVPAAFGQNSEAYRNYIGDALKKTRDVSQSLVISRYGSAPARSYFMGYSRGGGEALTVMQRWPGDWDGIVAGAAAWNWTTLSLQVLNATEAFASPGAFMSNAKRGVLYQAALSACDRLDGAIDGVISNVAACSAVFDPATASLNGTPLRCPGGLDTSDSCLSDAQIAALKRVNDPTPLSYSLGAGDSSLRGFPIYIADNGMPGSPLQPTISTLGLIGIAPPAFPVTTSMSLAWQLTDGFFRYLVADNLGLNPLTFDVRSGSSFAPRLQSLSALDANIFDLTPFKARGGKLLLWNGTADMLATPRNAEYYYGRVQATMGANVVDTFLRFYLLPGDQHSFSAVFQSQWDQLTALENWVEKGIDPGNGLVAKDSTGVPGRTRPICMFPSWPKYLGSGDLNSATSFACAAD